MATTITAMFDTRDDAEAARLRLKAARVAAENVHIHDKSSAGYSETGQSTHQDRGFWESVKHAFAPDEDRHTYEEGVRRGGTLLTADVDDDCMDETVRVLEEANSIDIDERADTWRASGWNHMGAVAPGTTTGTTPGIATDTTPGTTTGTTPGAAPAFAFGSDQDQRSDTGREEVIPIVEENLVVGKRDVSRGGVRVRSYVSETPVHEQVRLRNERVNVERRAVDQPLSTTDGDTFRERTIDMTATGEEAVVGKNARVVEEVVVSKVAEERVEDVSETVRHTEVDIDRNDDVATGTTGTFENNDKRI